MKHFFICFVFVSRCSSKHFFDKVPIVKIQQMIQSFSVVFFSPSNSLAFGNQTFVRASATVVLCTFDSIS